MFACKYDIENDVRWHSIYSREAEHSEEILKLECCSRRSDSIYTLYKTDTLLWVKVCANADL